MTVNLIGLSEFNLDSLHNTFAMPRDDIAGRMVVSQIYRAFLGQQKNGTAMERRQAALERTEKCINWNYGIFTEHAKDFADAQPDININALRIAVLLDSFERGKELHLPENIKADVREILNEARGVYENGPSENGYKRPETAMLVNVRMMAELNDGDQILVEQDADDLCYLVGTALYSFKKIVRTDTRIGATVFDRIDKMEDDGVKILKDHPDIPKIVICPLTLVVNRAPAPEI